MALGKEAFHGRGCAECHAVKQDDNTMKTGPSLFGLLRKVPLQHSVMDMENVFNGGVLLIKMVFVMFLLLHFFQIHVV